MQLSEVVKSIYIIHVLLLEYWIFIARSWIFYYTYWYVLHLDCPMPPSFLPEHSSSNGKGSCKLTARNPKPPQLPQCFGASVRHPESFIESETTSHCTDVFPSHWKKTTQHRIRSLAYSMWLPCEWGIHHDMERNDFRRHRSPSTLASKTPALTKLAIIDFCVYVPLHSTPPAAGSQPFAEFSTWMMAIVTATMATCHRRLQVLMHQPSKKWHILVSHLISHPQLGSYFWIIFQNLLDISWDFHTFPKEKICQTGHILVSLVACRITSMHPRTWKMEKCARWKRFPISMPFQRVNGHKGFLPIFYKMVVANEAIEFHFKNKKPVAWSSSISQCWMCRDPIFLVKGQVPRELPISCLLPCLHPESAYPMATWHSCVFLKAKLFKRA